MKMAHMLLSVLAGLVTWCSSWAVALAGNLHCPQPSHCWHDGSSLLENMLRKKSLLAVGNDKDPEERLFFIAACHVTSLHRPPSQRSFDALFSLFWGASICSSLSNTSFLTVLCCLTVAG